MRRRYGARYATSKQCLHCLDGQIHELVSTRCFSIQATRHTHLSNGIPHESYTFSTMKSLLCRKRVHECVSSSVIRLTHTSQNRGYRRRVKIVCSLRVHAKAIHYLRRHRFGAKHVVYGRGRLINKQPIIQDSGGMENAPRRFSWLDRQVICDGVVVKRL